jgi:thiamine monophosphate synthase
MTHKYRYLHFYSYLDRKSGILADYVAFGAFFPTKTKAVEHHAEAKLLLKGRADGAMRL